MDFAAGLGVSSEYSRTTFSRQLDIYVDAALGSDANDGTFNSPLKTFQEAVYRADDSYNPGENNIRLQPGTYNGAYINDDDLLKIYGMGPNPWDVNIVGDSSYGDTIHIAGGSDVRLYNMHVTGSSYNGIYAAGLDYLFMDRVYSDYHYESGFYGEDIHKTKIHQSVFQHNDGFGVYVEDGYKLRSQNSQFNYNGNDGVRADYVEHLQLVHSVARGNSYYGTGGRGGGSDADGVEAYDVGYVLVNGGSFGENDGRGIYMDYGYELTLLGVNASNNYEEGVLAEGLMGSALISGGRFEYNGNDGIHLDGYGVLPRGDGAGYNEVEVTVYGSQFFHNDDDGIEITGVYAASLFGVDARHNYEDGVDIEYSEYLHMGGGYLFQNYESGLDLLGVYHSQVNDLVSKENGEHGLELLGGQRLNVIGGNYSRNGYWGIYAEGGGFDPDILALGDGGYNELQRVDIKHATVRENEAGVYVGYSYLGKMVGGTYSDNEYEGIVFSNVAHGIFQDLYVNNNGADGLYFEAGLSMPGGPNDPSLRAGDDPYLSGSNWNRVELIRGLYNQNGYDGINIATDSNQGYYRNYIELDAQHVVSRDNGYTGLSVGGEYYNPVAGDGYGQASDLYLEMVGGYYGHNGEDGIYLLGTGQGPGPLGFLTASLTDVVAQHNDRFGLIGSGAVEALPGDRANYGVDDHDGYYSLIQMTRGSYSFNDQDGILWQYFVNSGNGPGMPGFFDDPDPGNLTSLGTFDHVVAVNNGYNGLSFSAYVSGDNGPTARAEGPTGNDPADMALLEFWGGVYNQNAGDGINIESDFAGQPEERDLGGYGILAARFRQVEASLNGYDGLYMRNYGSDYFRGDVEIQGGVFNANDEDGVFVGGLGYLSLNQVVIVANRDDGLHSYDNLDTSISQDSVITANLGENVRID